nr:hypothetical protein [Desulfobulbaceae bacterium]
MPRQRVTIFAPYSFEPGQKIRIEGGKRAGDWEVIRQSDKTVTLRCPISGREFEWSRFCYTVQENNNDQWPKTTVG